MDDHVDGVLAEWARLQPDWDLAGMAVFGRLARLERVAERRRSAVLDQVGLVGGDIDVLASLFRHPDGLRPKDLRHAMMIGSGTLTARLDRLEGEGLLRRRPDPRDRRGRILQLTARGRRLLPRIVEQLLAVENDLLAALPRRARDRLAGDLRRVLATVEGP